MTSSYKNLLLFDTSTVACSVALRTADGVFSRHQEQANIHSQALLVMIDELLIEANIHLTDLDILAIGVGPGSFTGLRIGIGVAQGLAYSNNIQLCAISSLELLAVSGIDFAKCPQQNLMVAHDARMSEIYTATYSYRQNTRLELQGDISLLAPEHLSFVVPAEELLLCGNAWQEYAERLQHLNIHDLAMLDVQVPDAVKAITYFDQNLDQFELINWQQLAPVYVRNNVAKKPKAR